MPKNHNFSYNLPVFLCSVLLLFLPGVALGQITNLTNDQFTPTPGAGHDYINMINEMVNPATGAVSLRIGVPTPPGRKLTLPFAFEYDSSGVHHITSNGGYANWQTATSYLSSGGWSYSVPQVWLNEAYAMTQQNGKQVKCYYNNDYVFEDPAGTRHALGIAAAMSPAVCGNGIAPFYFLPYSMLSGGDDLVRANSAAFGAPGGVTVADTDGTVFSFPGYGTHGVGAMSSALAFSVEDRNGNKILINDLMSPSGAFTMTDTVGRTVLSASSFNGASGDTITVSGLSPYQVTWAGAHANYSVGTHWQYTAGSCVSVPSDIETQPAIRDITLPNGQQYQFTYDSDDPGIQHPYGLLTKITYPSGGYVRYTWALNPLSDLAVFANFAGYVASCGLEHDSPAVSDRYVSFDGSTEVLHQHFAYSTSWSTPNSKTTTVTTTVGGKTYDTVYNYAMLYTPSQPDDAGASGGQVPVERTVTYKDENSNTLRTVNKSWWDLFEMACESTTQGGLTSRIDYNYSSHGAQVTDKKEWDWGQQSACPATYSGPPSGTPLRETVTAYTSFGNTLSYTAGPSIFDRPSSITTYANGVQVALTSYTYDGTSPSSAGVTVGRDANYNGNTTVPRGNATAISKWVNTSGGSLTWNYAYDDTGQQTSSEDPKGNTTSYTYTDDNAYLSQITYPTTNSFAHKVNFTYNLADGQMATSVDENNQTTNYYYGQNGELLDRLTEISYPDTGSTTYSYYSDCTYPATTTIALGGGTSYTETATLDGLCHVTSKSTSDLPTPDITDTVYDGLGRVHTVSNPYRLPPDSTYGLTTYTYDALGRTVNVSYPDSSVASTTYSANCTAAAGDCSTVTDPAGKTRRLWSDGLGRLTSVAEDPSGLNYLTAYAYNGFNAQVTQGSQTRTFVYDSLSRLTSATNPESGATSYAYPTATGSGICSGDPSLPCSRTDARSITTTYVYDALNRPIFRFFSDGTPAVSYWWDYDITGWNGWWLTGSQFNTIGRLSNVCTGPNGGNCDSGYTGVSYSYDAMGRVTKLWQATPYNYGHSAWEADYTYDLAGDVTSWNHPAGFTITQTISAAREITQVASSLNDSTHPASLATVTYTPFGSVSTLQNGCAGSGCTSLRETYGYNSRLQMAVAELGTSGNHSADSCRVYSYYAGAGATACSESSWPTGANDNGDVAGYYYNSVNTGLNHVATYAYDGVNRLTSAVATGNSTYNKTYTYTGYGSPGQYGNMSCAPAGPGCVAFTYNGANNRIAGYTYDLAGDVTNDGTYTYQWDAEGHLTKVINGLGTAISTNTYNALGQRVRDVTQTSTTDEAYGAGGNLLWRYTGSSSDPNQRAFVPFAGGILAEYWSGGTLFDHPDELGSISASTDHTGNTLNERLFYPYGESWTGAALPNLGTHQTFAQLPDYDPETDQYNTLNRHYSPSGRWMSPDPLGGRLVDPQTLNKYAYVRNNPTTLTDPLGLYMCDDDPSCLSKRDVEFEKARQANLKSNNADVVRAAKSYGDPTKDNGVTVQFGDPGNGKDAKTTNDLRVDPNDSTKFQAVETVTVRSGLSGPGLDAAVGHEGSHVADAQAFAATINMQGGFDASKNLSTYQTEFKAYMVTQSILSSGNTKLAYGKCGLEPCILGTGIMPAQANSTINQMLANPANRYGTAPNYGVTPSSPGPVLYPLLTAPK